VLHFKSNWNFKAVRCAKFPTHQEIQGSIVPQYSIYRLSGYFCKITPSPFYLFLKIRISHGNRFLTFLKVDEINIKKQGCLNACVQICQKRPLNNFNVYTKIKLKSNDFKQFKVWNWLSRWIKFSDQMNNVACFQRINFLYSMC